MMRPLLVAIFLSAACAPAPLRADAAPAAPAAPATKKQAATLLGALAGNPLRLADLSAEQSGALIRLEATFALERWKVLRTLAKQAAMTRALDIGAKKEGISTAQFLAKMKRQVPANPITREIVKAVYMSNRSHFEGRSLDQVRELITEQLKEEFEKVQIREIRNLLLLRYSFELKVAAPKLPRLIVDAAGAATMGGQKAKVTVVLFSDFECPYCARQATINEALAKHYGERVRWVYRHYPLDFHANAARLAHASLCAQAQGKFWPFHNRLFGQRSGYDPAGLAAHAKAVDVADLKRFKACLSDSSKAAAIETDKKAADKAFIEGTPTLFINGQPLYNMVDAADLQALLNAELTRVGVQPPDPMQGIH